MLSRLGWTPRRVVRRLPKSCRIGCTAWESRRSTLIPRTEKVMPKLMLSTGKRLTVCLAVAALLAGFAVKAHALPEVGFWKYTLPARA
jgi:hypothetical protein